MSKDLAKTGRARIETFMASARHQVEASQTASQRLAEDLSEIDDLELRRLAESFAERLTGLRTLLAEIERYVQRVYGVGQ